MNNNSNLCMDTQVCSTLSLDDKSGRKNQATVIVLFGVCGCGKSTIGMALNNYLNNCNDDDGNDTLEKKDYCSFLEGDLFHSTNNVEKMSKGIPLNDQDRRPWLLAIHLQIMNEIKHSNRKYVVVSCSALKNKYRELLVTGDAQLCENEEQILDKPIQQYSDLDINWLFVNLSISQNEAKERLENRHAHFMNSSLIPSQFETLELIPLNPEFKNVKLVIVDNQQQDADSVVQQICQLIKY